jgi:phage head maturation protease
MKKEKFISRQRNAGKSQISDLRTRAEFDVTSFNEESRSVDIVFATETPVITRNWRILDGSPFNEVLSMQTSDVRLERASKGLPILKDHWNSVDNQVGIATDIRISGTEARAKVTFSRSDEGTRLMNDVKDGIIRNISCGYRVYAYSEVPLVNTGETPTLRATDWEPMEISFVAVPADMNSSVRADGAEEYPVSVQNITNSNSNNSVMKREQIIAFLNKRGVQFESTATDEQLAELMQRTLDEIPAPTPAPAPTPTPTPAPRAENASERSTAITNAVRAAKLESDFALELINSEKSVDQARAAIIEKLAASAPNANPANPSASVTNDQADDNYARGIEEAILHRSNPRENKLTDLGRDFRGMTLMEMAREAVERRGLKTRGMSPREVAQMALTQRSERGYHSTSDFPIILGNTINRTLRAAYDNYPQTFRPWTSQSTAKDFRDKIIAQFGSNAALEEVIEGAEYKYGTATESKEQYRVKKYGKIIAFTWESLINDDLSAFSRVPSEIARNAAQLESDTIYNILLNNPTMGDSVALFHSTHANLAGTATAITEAGLSAARAAIRKQTDIAGRVMNLAPAYLICGPDKETEAQKIINATIMATKTADTNVFRNSLEIIVDPRLTGNQWYLACAPSMIDTIEYSYLEGENGLFTEQRVGFDVDGLQIKARLVFGAKAIEYRGLYKNAGA